MRQKTVFICHASEDKATFVQPLADELRRRGVSVWYDEYSLAWGDSLRSTIDRGVASADFGLVILSPSFFAKEWPAYELDGLLGREMSARRTLILPVWHRVDHDDVAKYSPSLAQRLAVKSDVGRATIATRVIERLATAPTAGVPPTPRPPSLDNGLGSLNAAEPLATRLGPGARVEIRADRSSGVVPEGGTGTVVNVNEAQGLVSVRLDRASDGQQVVLVTLRRIRPLA